MKQYLDLCTRLVETGEWVVNPRTGKRCLTMINADLEYDVSDGTLPVLTTKKLYWKPAIAEMLGYLRGYTSAAQFRAIGCNTWNENANNNQDWLDNPFVKAPMIWADVTVPREETGKIPKENQLTSSKISMTISEKASITAVRS
jgi:thymidylate synthase